MTYQPPAPKARNINVKLTPGLYKSLRAAFPDNLSHGVRHILQEYIDKEQRRARRKERTDANA